MSIIVHGNHKKSLFNIYKRSFCSQGKKKDFPKFRKFRTPGFSKWFRDIEPKQYNTELMESSDRKKITSKISNKLHNKYKIQLPIHSETKTQPTNVLQGKSQLLKKFNTESDIYIRGNTQYVNRKYEPLIEQVDQIDNLDISEQSQDTKHKQPYDSYGNYNYMDDQLSSMDGSDNFDTFKTDKMNEKPMKLHQNWQFFFRGDDAESLYNEAETWNVIAHVNKRHSYGKSLRYCDRFYRNWAIEIARQEDEYTKDARIKWAQTQNQFR
eukprot:413127_1